MKNIYVGNISYQTTEEQLNKLFGQYGTVSSAKVITDSRSGRSKGFAFVEMEDGAEEAIAATNGTEFDGRTLRVAEAQSTEERSAGGERPRQNRGPRRGGGGGYGGGRGGQGRSGGGGGYGGGNRSDRSGGSRFNNGNY